MAEDRAYFDRPDIWNRPPEPYQVQVRADIQSMLPRDVESVLDAGCGNGFVANALPARVRVVGLDISHEALKYVERETQHGSILRLPFGDGSFDLVMTNDVLEHLDDGDLKQALCELRRVARKHILITAPLNEQLESNQARCAGCGSVYHVNRHLRSFSELSVERLIRGKFRIVETRLSGDFTARPFDPTVALRHKLGAFRVWSGGMCPRCNSREQTQTDAGSIWVRALDALRARQWAKRLAESGPWNNRSEIIALFSASPGTYEAADEAQETGLAATRVSPLRVDFSNAAQQARPDFTPGAILPMFLPSGRFEISPEGLRAVERDKNAPPLRVVVCFPFEPGTGDSIEIRCVGSGGVAVRIQDPILGRGKELFSRDYARSGTHCAKKRVPADWWPGRVGWALEIDLRGALALASLDLVRAADAGNAAKARSAEWDGIALKRGHAVIRRKVGGVVRSWGCVGERDGIYPRPMLESAFSAKTKTDRVEVSWEESVQTLGSAHSHIEREIANLAAVLEAAESSRGRAEERYATLGAEHLALRRELESTHETLAANEANRAKAERAYSEAERLLGETDKARAAAEEAYARSSAACDALQRDLESTHRILATTEANRVMAEEAYSEVQRQFNRSEASRAKAEDAYAESSKAYEVLQRELESIRQVLATTEANRAKAETAYAETERRLSETEKACAAAEEAYAQLSGDLPPLQREMESIRQVLATTEANRAKAETAYSETQRLLDRTEKARASAEDALANAEQARLAAEESLAKSRAQSQALTREVATLRERYEEDENALAKMSESLERAVAQRDVAENAYVALQERHHDLQARVHRLEAECESMRGIWGGAREILYVFKKRLLRLREGLFRAKKRILGWQPEMPAEWFPPERWRTLDAPPPVTGDRPCVLVLSHMFPHPDQPGLGCFILDQVRALREHANIDVRVLSGRPFWMNRSKNPLMLWRLNRVYFRFLETVRWREIAGVPVMYVPYRVAKPWIHGCSYRQAMRRVVSRVRESFPFTLVHSHTAFLDGTAGLAIARRYGVPFLITEHTGPFSHLLRGRVMTCQTKRALNGADLTIAVSSALKKCMAEVMTPDRSAKTIVIPNGVDLNLFRPPAEYRPDPRSPRVFFVGGLGPVKNLRLLVRAFALVARDVPGATLSLVGSEEIAGKKDLIGALARELGVADKVRFLGPKTREEVARLLREEADLLVLSSRTETFGCVLIEAMACGKPVVATRCGGPEDIVTTDAVGRLCESDNAEDLARALRETIEALPRFSKDAIRAHAVECFAYESLAPRIAAIYRTLLSSRS